MSSAVEPFDLHADGSPPADPWSLARQWLPEDDDPDRPRVTLATIGEDGCPDARTVLLSAVDESGFAFHTAASSRKVGQLAASPLAAMVVLRPDSGRQLVVRGDVVPDSPDSELAAWAARVPYLRRLAVLNTDELARLPLAERLERWAAGSDSGPPAESWLGFRLQPREMTFWAAHPDTASRRLRYVRTGNGWSATHAAG
ncbi:pyridoxamine 5'-phosphate oxidase family protein [Blastococcus sp. LR1]|uniref:pyridoxamine 5'-phosphate oxidase family protein n=1 Tax=Blastococcus sp. LR1 TaxID=2877000 RepID=UPI001CCBBB06|nr:pyridoxamine 5'-phosphate oxidase family protein [Blastococcus sp. LR1]MCA0145290.1 pyridoxamine 5'-phosphate oxidase family protein [Blastococcus sp. LR1]